MGEVLSQSQIDALLNSMNSAEEEPEPEKEEIKYRKYDFKTPKKYTKDRLRVISNIYDNYARIISSHLTSMLRLSCTIELAGLEELRYYEYDNALSEDDLLVFSNVMFHEQSDLEVDPLMMVFSSEIILYLVSRMLGCTETKPDNQNDSSNSSEERYTEIELAVYETVLQHIIPLMNDAWQAYLDMGFDYHRIETNPKLIQPLSVDEVVVLAPFNITLGETTGQITICLPGTLLDAFFRILENESMRMHRKKDTQKEEERVALQNGIENSPLELITRFDLAKISLNDVYRLQVGDILNLHIPKDSDIQVCIEEKPWFTGKLGVYKEHKAIMITGAVDQEQGE